MTTNVQGWAASPGSSSTHPSRRRVQLIAQVLTIRNQRFDHGAEVSPVPRDGSLNRFWRGFGNLFFGCHGFTLKGFT